MYIYKITNLLNNKIYIGQSQKHVNESEKYYGSGNLIKESIRKYGKHNFRKEIIEICISSEELDKKECYWIKKYKSQDKSIGYNILDGGQRGQLGNKNPATWDDVRAKMRKPKSEQGRENIRAAIKKQNRKKENNSFYGKKHTKESMDKMVNSRKVNNNGNYHPDGNVTAKTFKFISPTGDEFIVFNKSKQFCDEKNISFRIIRKLNGIPYKLGPQAGRANERTKNTVGWSVVEI